MTEYLKLGTTVVGGLALFVYGMGLMSDGLKETAGAKMKAALNYMTRNRVFAILAGALVTALIQSSSATSVMTVGFVNAGLLSLEQAIGVIFGANIGTTITGQIVSLKLNDLALPAITLGVAGLMIARRTTTRGVWRTLLGFGLLFFGMSLMSHELKALSKEPGFIAFFSLFDCTPDTAGHLPFGSLLGAVAVGTVCTILVQSSSATIGITIALAETGIIPIWTAIPIVLGDNIGTTATAALAAIGGNANAKRTALAHALFNILGTLLVITSFAVVFTGADGIAAPVFFHAVDYFTAGNGLAGEAAGRHVAMAHTLFNLTNVVVLAFFIPLLARLCTTLVPARGTARTTALEPLLLDAPALALEAARTALADMTRRAWTMASVVLKSCLGRATVEAEAVENAEREIDALQLQIRDYLVALSQRKLTEKEARMLPELLHCVNDAERISDLALKIFRKAERIQRAGLAPALADGMNDLARHLRTFALDTISAVRHGTAPCGESRAFEYTIQHAARRLSHNGACDLTLQTLLYGIRDISRHLGNIAERAVIFS
ncbi:MAG: Na/Pi cotransporter family protein [Kiritimatiellia bacterium]